MDYTDFSSMLLKILNNVISPSSSFVASFSLDNEEKRGILEFFQDTEFRRVEMLRLDFEECDEETVKN